MAQKKYLDQNGLSHLWEKIKAHVASQFPVPLTKGGTGQTTAINAANAFINALGEETSSPQDADYYISQHSGGGTTTSTYHRRPMSALWEYVKNKINSVLGLTSATYGGSAAKVNDHTVQSDVPANAVFTDTTYSNATASTAGLMSAADKEKLDGMSSTRVYDDTLEYKTQSGWSPVDITLQPFTAVAEASVEWELGAISSSSGANSNSSTRLRTVSYLPSGIVSITPASGYRFVLVAYDDGTYIGAWNGTSYAKSATWLTARVEASDLGQHDFRIVFARSPDSGTMTVDEKSSISIVYNARMTVNDLARRTISLEKALMGIDISDPESAIYALALRVAQLEAHAILDSGYPSDGSS